MSDERERELERQAAAGDPQAQESLKRAWLRTQTFHQCERCGGTFPGDLWQEHQEQCKEPEEEQEEQEERRSGGMRIVQLQGPGVFPSRPRKEPLYDREVIQPDQHTAFFFQDFAHKGPLDTNLCGPGGLPVGHHFFFYGVSLIPDALADPDDVRQIYDRGHLSMETGSHLSTTHLQYPARVVMDDQPELEDELQEQEEVRVALEGEIPEFMPEPPKRLVRLRHSDYIRDVRISNRPIELPALQNFRWRLQVTGHEELPWRQGPVGLMLVMFGLLLRGVTA